MLVAHLFGGAHQVKQQRAGNVVRQIAHHPQPLAELREIDRQGVGLDHGQPFGGVLPAQARGQIAVDLDRGQVIDAIEQGAGQRRQARTDLDHAVVARGPDGPHDRLDHALVGQEMLAEALARLVC
ncbi:Uncharacterised protein [Bordetella pertussis]|nr:Uncharacterised protein [Bordetella pertussis]CFM63461.1 Uncharacterised protein [Bordetella pertussis]CFM92158.1 Uncharacterised protein [Bordetella pertussis]CFN24751.1 Uncharacterised protein [Bordetella pertussis]CFN60623.1 Uncharacterised protein [Bordetella pertussis]